MKYYSQNQTATILEIGDGSSKRDPSDLIKMNCAGTGEASCLSPESGSIFLAGKVDLMLGWKPILINLGATIVTEWQLFIAPQFDDSWAFF